MNHLIKWWRYLTTETPKFKEALKNIEKGDVIVVEKHLPCYIWENRFTVTEINYQKFLTDDNRVWFKSDGNPYVRGMEIITIKSKSGRTTKYPSNLFYFLSNWVVALVIFVGLLWLYVLLVNFF